jgi:hypothetical protein
MAKDYWVTFELPGFAKADSGNQQISLGALRKATKTSFFKGPDAVRVKLVIIKLFIESIRQAQLMGGAAANRGDERQ